MKNISHQIARLSTLMLFCIMTLTTLSLTSLEATNTCSNKQEDIKAMWSAYVVNKAALSGEEADRFLTLFREYQETLDEVKAMPDVSEQEVARLEAKQGFIKQLQESFSANQVNEILTAYKEFQIKILDYLKKKKETQSGQ